MTMTTKSHIRAGWLGLLLCSFAASADIPFNGGMTGTWHDPLAPGQGLILEIIPGGNRLFAGWFTHQPLANSSPGPSWLTLQGGFSGSIAQVALLQVNNGAFATASEISYQDVGYASLTALSCTSIRLEYVFRDEARSGHIDMQRVTPDLYCAEQNTQPPMPSEFNMPPTVSAISTSVSDGQVSLLFDLSDPENDLLDLRIRVHGPDQLTHDIPLPHLTGHVSYPVVGGPNQLVVWNFAQDHQFQALGWQNIRLEVVADDRQLSTLQSIIDSVSEQRIIQDIQALEGIRHHQTNPGGLDSARDYIQDQMSAHGLNTAWQTFNHQGSEGINLIAEKAATTISNQVYIIDGHYDTVSRTPGADDNASGTAGMLEAMRVLAQFNTQANLRFIAFDKEELGLVGSRHYASRLAADEQIAGLINFEMIGYTCSDQPECVNFPNADTSIYNIHSAFSTALGNTFAQVGQTHVPGLKIVTVGDDGDPNFRRSDHAPFWDIGVDALFLTDGANFRTPHYHQVTDRLATLDTTFTTQIVQTAVGTIASLAGVNHQGSAMTEVIQIAQ
jgi:hypothetical protein